ncbi:MAG TPA: carboxylating nicotinate-nucleotide diphosphorylase [Myxococcota bacterium]|nr:carboxylating nicotinate-nucleotide diphosphorylase [Myxococcota bacterium]HRY91834.1 carboxylating nicotinate-nucleotide diphosphorylase [Myxococcota bacterium]HSA21908.1 carboxylating nicotinate-nucleotide diphosphorylase [Myxococcota bacterium]
MPPPVAIQALIELALAEDLGTGDLTSEALFSPTRRSAARLVAREPLVVSGLWLAEVIFQRLDGRCRVRARVDEGAWVRAGAVLAEVRGPTRALLSGERTALNFVRHLCGVASLTRSYARVLAGTGCTLLDTRKTTPGMRALEKAAVRAGGGHNHRMGLFDGVMIKDNHIAAAGSIARAVAAARRRVPPTVRIEVECERLAQVEQAVRAGADIVMLDNMPPARMAAAVRRVAGRARTEASGRVTLARLAEVARTGVDYVSVGALTHSAPSADIALDFGR